MRIALFAVFMLVSGAANATTITVAAGTVPPLDPCYVNCHWEQIVDTTPDHEQTAAEVLADLLHEPEWIDFVLWCPPVVPFAPPSGRPPVSPPSEPPTGEPPVGKPPTPVSEGSTWMLLALGIAWRRVRGLS